ncbi:hypothetical protein ACN47E_009676 [Coniothyrium glycines]
MFKHQSRNIGVVGASSNIGKPAIQALFDNGIHSITVISRAMSSARPPSNVVAKKVTTTRSLSCCPSCRDKTCSSFKWVSLVTSNKFP